MSCAFTIYSQENSWAHQLTECSCTSHIPLRADGGGAEPASSLSSLIASECLKPATSNLQYLIIHQLAMFPKNVWNLVVLRLENDVSVTSCHGICASKPHNVKRLQHLQFLRNQDAKKKTGYMYCKSVRLSWDRRFSETSRSECGDELKVRATLVSACCAESGTGHLPSAHMFGNRPLICLVTVRSYTYLVTVRHMILGINK